MIKKKNLRIRKASFCIKKKKKVYRGPCLLHQCRGFMGAETLLIMSPTICLESDMSPGQVPEIYMVQQSPD